MDALKSEVRKAAPVDESLRRPLLPSEKNNAAPAGRRREVASRYKSGVPPAPALASSTTRRCTSPSFSRPSAAEGTPPLKRAQSADRRRTSTPSTPSSRVTPLTPVSRSTTPVHDTVTEVHSSSRRAISARVPDGVWPSVRNLSSSFQSESMAAPAKKKDKAVTGSSIDQAKVQASTAAERKRSPLRGKNIGEQCENSRPSENPPRRTTEQHRWPAMMNGRGAVRLTSKNIGLLDKANRSVSSSITSRGLSPRKIHPFEVRGNGLNQPFNDMTKRLAIDGSRREDKADSSSDVSSQTSEGPKSVCRPSRTVSSPVPLIHRPSSPNKVMSAVSSISRAFQSPSRIRPSTPCRSQSASTSQSGVTPHVINYIVDARKGKKNASQIENIHQLRLLYNRYLQWHFINARAEDTLSFQKISVESILYSVWKSTLKLRDAVTIRRIETQHLRHELNLCSILREQIAYLEQWPALESENCSSLVGAIQALKASTLRLPVTSGAQADAVAVKNAISSSVDVMQALGSSICYLLSKVEDRTSLVSELPAIAGQEKAMLEECRELLTTATTLQVQESSQRIHLMQLRQGVVEMN